MEQIKGINPSSICISAFVSLKIPVLTNVSLPIAMGPSYVKTTAFLASLLLQLIFLNIFTDRIFSVVGFM